MCPRRPQKKIIVPGGNDFGEKEADLEINAYNNTNEIK